MAMNLNLNKNAKSNQSNKSDDWVPSKLWANVGVYAEIDGENVFVNLGGIPLDNLKEVNGNSPLSKLKRLLQKQAKEGCASLEPGQAEVVPELVVEFRHAAENEDIDATEAEAPIRLTFGKKVA